MITISLTKLIIMAFAWFAVGIFSAVAIVIYITNKFKK
jgi:hypothetical protein